MAEIKKMQYVIQLGSNCGIYIYIKTSTKVLMLL
jgi:hypothetical protein